MWDVLPAVGAILLLAVLVVAIAVAIVYLVPPAFRFWFLDIWSDLPLIGTVARLSRMSHPTADLANRRLEKLFRAYHNHIMDPLPQEEYKNARKYLSLAGDSDNRPAPFMFRMMLLLLMVAEAFTFSFLLGVSISPDISEELAEILAVVLAIVMAVLFAALAHPAGHLIRRTHTLKAACRNAVGEDMSLGKGEKTHKELTESIDLDDPQDKDEPRKHNFDSQRLLNRSRKHANDQGSYFLPILFIIMVLAAGWFQYNLRAGSSFVSELLDLPAAQLGQDTPTTANSFFVLIFFLTQGLALYIGYKFGFLGRDSARAYRIVGGRDTHRDYMQEYEARERRADESLTSLYAKFRRYKHIKPENLNYRQRSERLRRNQEGGRRPPPRPSSPQIGLVPPAKNGPAA